MSSGAIYGLFIYDANLNLLGSFASSGNETRLWQLPRNTMFFIEIRSINGAFSATQNYRLSLQALAPPSNPYSQRMVTLGGNVVGIRGNNLYIDGIRVHLNGTLMHITASTVPSAPNTWILCQQTWVALSGGVQFLGIHGVGTYTSSVLASPVFRNVSSNNAVVVYARNVNTIYSAVQRVNNVVVATPSRTINVPGHFTHTFIVIDATTRNVIDFPHTNELRISYGHIPRLNWLPIRF